MKAHIANTISNRSDSLLAPILHKVKEAANAGKYNFELDSEVASFLCKKLNNLGYYISSHENKYHIRWDDVALKTQEKRNEGKQPESGFKIMSYKDKDKDIIYPATDDGHVIASAVPVPIHVAKNFCKIFEIVRLSDNQKFTVGQKLPFFDEEETTRTIIELDEQGYIKIEDTYVHSCYYNEILT